MELLLNIPGTLCTPNKSGKKYTCKDNSLEKVKVLLFPLKEKIKIYIGKDEFGEVPDLSGLNPVKIEVKIGKYTYQSIENWTVKSNENKTQYKIKK